MKSTRYTNIVLSKKVHMLMFYTLRLLLSLYFYVAFMRTINSQQFRPAGSGSKGITVEVMPLAEGPNLQPHVRFKHLP